MEVWNNALQGTLSQTNHLQTKKDAVQVSAVSFLPLQFLDDDQHLMLSQLKTTPGSEHQPVKESLL